MTMLNRLCATSPLLVTLAAPARPAVGVRLVLGLTDTEFTKWDGGVTARGASITSIEPWRFEGKDAINGNQWTISTHNIRLFGGQNAPAGVVISNGVIVWLDGESDSSELQVNTPHGSFTVKLSDIPYGKQSFALTNGSWPTAFPAFRGSPVLPTNKTIPPPP
jgi:hypothetical protein